MFPRDFPPCSNAPPPFARPGGLRALSGQPFGEGSARHLPLALRLHMGRAAPSVLRNGTTSLERGGDLGGGGEGESGGPQLRGCSEVPGGGESQNGIHPAGESRCPLGLRPGVSVADARWPRFGAGARRN